MSGLLDSLSAASNALLAQRMGLDVAGQNIANINTPGYTRRELVLAEAAPSDPLNAGRGVTVVQVRALRDQLVEARLRSEQGDGQRDAALAEVLDVVEAAVGLPGASLDQQLAALFDAFSTLAQDVMSPVARDMVVREGQTLAQAFGDLTTRLSTAQSNADLSVRSAVLDVNRLTAEIARLNVAISAGGPDVESLRDQQVALLDQLSKLADIAVLQRQDGAGVDVTLASGRALVIGENADDLTASPGGMASITLGGFDVTTEIRGGRIGGLLQARDVVLPGYQSQLDQLAYDLAAAVNSVHASGFDATGAPAGDFFTPLAGVAGAAGLLAVDPSLVADPQRVAASSTGAVGDNAVARQLAALRDAPVVAGGTRTADAAWSQFVFTVGSDVANAHAAGASRGKVVAQLQALRAETSGVSYDEEAAHLMRYQRAYEANARYFTTILDTLDALMEMVR